MSGSVDVNQVRLSSTAENRRLDDDDLKQDNVFASLSKMIGSSKSKVSLHGGDLGRTSDGISF